MVRVKVCGITNLKDARAAVRYGADAVGMIFARSPRRIKETEAMRIARELDPFVTLVGVFVDEKPVRMKEIAERCGIRVLQLHGDESPSVCRKLKGFKLIKVFRVGQKFEAAAAAKYPVDAIMLETDAPVKGGSGMTWDWKKAAGKRFKKPLIVTGGLKPDNVLAAIRALKPYAVDVSSGIEAAPGRKDHKKMKLFIRRAKRP